MELAKRAPEPERAFDTRIDELILGDSPSTLLQIGVEAVEETIGAEPSVEVLREFCRTLFELKGGGRASDIFDREFSSEDREIVAAARISYSTLQNMCGLCDQLGEVATQLDTSLTKLEGSVLRFGEAFSTPEEVN